MVIGYSFGDSHINDVLIEAARDHGLKLFVLTTSEPQTLKNRLENIDSILWQSLGGYFTNTIKGLYPYGVEHRNTTEHIFRTLGVI
ncbi:hypothetical protein COU76_00900 [Candidatus Peregrinibacteria bacterium CG10_big_fil_rev_8_21_14_0_10_49_10]|nr:MAG: hypothetical protein COU76_00900 [Candidatus Peregrinibacteria bacterium CG10_big_fil_rev_8_21_14_0_10_49_10]